MYAILIQFDTETLKILLGDEKLMDAQHLIEPYMKKAGFSKMGTLHLGDEDVTPVTCELIIQKIRSQFDWFSAAVSDIEMLRISEICDMKEVLEK